LLTNAVNKISTALDRLIKGGANKSPFGAESVIAWY